MIYFFIFTVKNETLKKPLINLYSLNGYVGIDSLICPLTWKAETA